MNDMPRLDDGRDPPLTVDADPVANDHLMLGVLSLVEGQGDVSQRSVARHLGVALGLANSYVRRCVRKGFIKVAQAPARRYRYYLTPQGFAEKSRLTAAYLQSSLQFFGVARTQCEAVLKRCADCGWTRIAAFGVGDLADIFGLLAREWPLAVVRVPTMDALPADLSASFDAVVLVDLQAPQAAFDALCALLPPDRLLAPPLLRVKPRPPEMLP